MRAFRDRKVSVLVATDVACRGLDVKDITHVINYSIPRELDNYVHRIGRTGRVGKTGLALSLVTQSHRGLIGRIERMTRSKMREGKIPSRKEIGIKKVAKALDRFGAEESFAKAEALLTSEWRQRLAGMETGEIVGRFLTLLHPEIFAERPSQAAEPSPAVVKVQDESRSARPAPKAKSPWQRNPRSADARPFERKPAIVARGKVISPKRPVQPDLQ